MVETMVDGMDVDWVVMKVDAMVVPMVAG